MHVLMLNKDTLLKKKHQQKDLNTWTLISLKILILIKEYEQLKENLENIYIEKRKGAMIRSMAQFIDNDEKCSKYFLYLEKCTYKTKYIKSLINCDGKK